jgi:hypothetical protein
MGGAGRLDLPLEWEFSLKGGQQPGELFGTRGVKGGAALSIRGRQLWWVLVIGWILAAAAAAGQEGSLSPPAAPGIAAPAVVSSQLGAMLGGAEFMLIMDRPFEAEKLFNAVLAMDPKNVHALDGVRRVKLAKRTSWTFLVHGYGNRYDTQLETWGGGPSFYTSLGKVTFWAGDGFFRSDGVSLQKVTLNGFWEPYYKNFDGYVYVNRTFYMQAPDRTLYTFKGTWNRHHGREYFSLFGGQHDSYLQSDLAQFFAEESYPQVKEKILNRNVGAAAQIALGKYIDLMPAFSQFYYTKGIADYTNGNSRRIAQGKVMYRVLPRGESQMPIFRVGVSYLADSCERPSLIYNCPVNFQSVSISADYVFVTGKYRYGVFASVPVTGASGTGGGRFNPPQTLYTFLNYKLSESQELWVKFTGVHSANYSPTLFDIVVGATVRF